MMNAKERMLYHFALLFSVIGFMLAALIQLSEFLDVFEIGRQFPVGRDNGAVHSRAETVLIQWLFRV